MVRWLLIDCDMAPSPRWRPFELWSRAAHLEHTSPADRQAAVSILVEAGVCYHWRMTASMSSAEAALRLSDAEGSDSEDEFLPTEAAAAAGADDGTQLLYPHAAGYQWSRLAAATGLGQLIVRSS